MKALGHPQRLLRVSLMSVAVSGCMSAEQHHQFYEPLRAKVNDEAKEVAAHVTPEHFERCKQLLSGKNWLGTEYRVEGTFDFNLKMTCHAQDRIFKNYKVAVYQVANQKVGEGIDLKGKVTACEIRLLPDGKIEVLNGSGNLSGPSNSNCHRI
jgi:hypothetical protein